MIESWGRTTASLSELVDIADRAVRSLTGQLPG
jgi:hypothetical protein